MLGGIMDDKKLYAAILGLTPPWGVEKVDLRLAQGEVHIWVALPEKEYWVCPECHQRAPIKDHRERIWRHLDTCQYRTLVHARVPRLNCPTHGVKQLPVPWAESGSRFTALFEALVIDWLRQAPISAVAKQLGLTWDQVSGIQERAVRRGLARRELEPVVHMGIDETAFQRRHEYVTVVSDLDGSRVLFVADGRKRESLDGFWSELKPEHLGAIEAVAMDMWAPYIGSVMSAVPDAASKIVFDKFHVAMHLNEAVDRVRRQEHRALMELGIDRLKGTKHTWLRNPASFSLGAWRSFLATIRTSTLKTARAWRLKEDFMAIYDYQYLGVAQRHYEAWKSWAMRSRLEPIKRVARMIVSHWDNIKTYFTHRLTNAGSESMNSKIQRVKAMARGYRNRQRFRDAIYFHCGGLDLYPSCLRNTQ
jgi:transposase